MSLRRFKEQIREITRRNRGVSVAQVVSELAQYIRGWVGYFGFCEARYVLRDLHSWIRRRLRCFIWKKWKTFRKRRRGLMERKIAEAPASQTAARSRGCWSTSNVSPLRYAFPKSLERYIEEVADLKALQPMMEQMGVEPRKYLKLAAEFAVAQAQQRIRFYRRILEEIESDLSGGGRTDAAGADWRPSIAGRGAWTESRRGRHLRDRVCRCDRVRDSATPGGGARGGLRHA